ncbi:tubulin delta [Paragonimus westermani]|uniref:Tubulin delta n=1 Tax=Paragonimus westermani TaxID=34504 RepID=A0A5J4P0Y6_9TREM|nr:tubulin delta [Paragonimus westermani]
MTIIMVVVVGNLSDLVPKAPTLIQLVWPYCRGEVSVQAYNTVLTLGHALSSSGNQSLDGFIIHHNDTLHNICSTRLRASQPNCPVGLDQLNSLAAHQLAGLLQPHSIASESGAGSTCYRRLSTLLCHLCGHPDYRLLRLRCLPYFGPACREFATETWPQLARHGRQMLLTGSSVEDNTVQLTPRTAPPPRSNRIPISTFTCYHCGEKHEAATDRRHKQSTCHGCGKIGDIPRAIVFRISVFGWICVDCTQYGKKSDRFGRPGFPETWLKVQGSISSANLNFTEAAGELVLRAVMCVHILLWEDLALNRTAWRNTVRAGVRTFSKQLLRGREQKRAVHKRTIGAIGRGDVTIWR